MRWITFGILENIFSFFFKFWIMMFIFILMLAYLKHVSNIDDKKFKALEKKFPGLNAIEMPGWLKKLESEKRY